MYMEKNGGRLKSTPVILPHETVKDLNSGAGAAADSIWPETESALGPRTSRAGAAPKKWRLRKTVFNKKKIK